MTLDAYQTALVTGATGFIGSYLIDSLLKRDFHVRVLVRNLQSAISLHGKIDICQGDITDSQALKRAADGADVIFHLAAKLHISNPSPSLKAKYEQVNVEGTRHLVEIAQSSGIRRFIFFSTINVYGVGKKGLTYDENSPLYLDSLYAQTKARAEKIVLKEIPSVVLRLAAVYGPGMKGNYPRLVNALRHGRFVMIGDGQNRRTLVHVHDVCQAAILAAEHPAALGRVYNVTDGQIHTMQEIIHAICSALGKKPPTFKLPTGIIRPTFGLLEDGLRFLGKRSPVGRSTVDKFIEDMAVSGERIQQQLGFKPQYDLLSGWRETIRQFLADNN